MDEIRKSYAGSPMKANAVEDIGLINSYALRELKPEEVFVFNCNLCDDQIDRDMEAFSVRSLKKLKELFIGKPLITDHEWSADNQLGRVYKTQLFRDGDITRLRASLYMLRTPGTEETIKQLEAGILREVSVGFRVQSCNCSVCGDPLSYGYSDSGWKRKCSKGHVVGEIVNGKTVHGVLEEPLDAFEVSLVAVPAQRQAGVTKGQNRSRDLDPLESEDRKKIFEEANGITITDDVWELIISGKLDGKAVAEAERKKQAKPAKPKRYEDIVPEDDGMAGNVRYAIIPNDIVDKSTREGIFEAMGFCRKELNLPPIQVKWFMLANDALMQGMSLDSLKTFRYHPKTFGLASRKNPNQILVRYRPTADLAEIKQTIFHELWHTFQMRDEYSKLDEESACWYAEDAYKRYITLSAGEKEALYFDELLMKDYSSK